MVAQDALLVHPNYKKHFDVHIDASKVQMGGVVSQEGKAITYFSKNSTLLSSIIPSQAKSS